MKALRYDTYGGPEVLQVHDLPAPRPGPRDVIVRVRAATVGPGDCKARAGLLQRHFSVQFPKIPGRYGCGDVVEAGEQVEGSLVGERVVFATLHTESGSSAELVRCAPSQLAPMPRNLSYIETAAVIQGGVCAFVSLCEAGEISSGMHVLVHGGAGAVGSACVQLAHHLGAHVSATCRSTDRAFVQALGAERIVSFDQEEFSQILQQQDVVIDLMGGDVHRRSYPVLKRGGRLVYLNADPFEDRSAAFGVRLINAVIDNRRSVLEAVVALAERGVFAPRVGRVLPLASGAEAHRLVETGAVRRGRVVLEVN